MTTDELIKHFDLEPLPVEGGLFRRHYEAEETIPSHALPERYDSHKLHSSAITYLHTAETRSLLHRLKTDEIYHFYNGDPVELVLLFPDGSFQTILLGHNYSGGHVPFYAVPRGVWQGSALVPGGSWALLGMTMAPAYDVQDFELGVRDELLAQYPAARELIFRLT
jgi:predicted cupin superfamily sugar epimerase